MRRGFMGLVLRSAMGALAASFLFVNAGMADLTNAQLQSYEQQFLANPSQFLATNFANGGSDLAAVIQALAADPANLNTIINALANANPNQQAAMGTGLGQAAKAAQASNPSYANQIQTAVVAAGLQQVYVAYLAAIGDTLIGGLGGGAGGGGGTGGGGGGAGGGGGTGAGGGTGGSQQANSGQTLTGGTSGSTGSTSPF